MASSWIVHRRGKNGRRYIVRYRLGGRESKQLHAGSFRTRNEALVRRRWIDGELAAMRVPDLGALRREPERAPMFAVAAKRWQDSRLDVIEATAVGHAVAVGRMLPFLGNRRVDAITAADIADAVAVLHAKGLRRATIRKSLSATAMVLDHAGISPNPARDKIIVRLPYEEEDEPQPPIAAHLVVVHALLPHCYRLPLLVYDDTGMRISELENLVWGDVDEPQTRWRITKTSSKTRKARWVPVNDVLFAKVLDLLPREDRTADRQVFEGFSGDSFRTAIARACRDGGVPLFSPHDLRHRRISLDYHEGGDWAEIGKRVGQRNLSVTANTYTHVLTDWTELDYPALLEWDRVHEQALAAPPGHVARLGTIPG